MFLSIDKALICKVGNLYSAYLLLHGLEQNQDGKRKAAFTLFLPAASHMLELGLVEAFGEKRVKSQLF